MAIEDILEKIERDNREKVNGIISEAEAKADQVKEEYRGKGRELGDDLDRKFRRKAEEHGRQIVVSEQLELRKKLLTEKRKLLEEFYSAAREKISSMSGDDYAAFIRKLILERAVTGKEEIVIPPDHSDIFTDEFIRSLNQQFEGGSFSVSSETGDFDWGVVLREKDRLIDLSLESFFKELTDRIEPEAASILFSAEEGVRGEN